MPRMCGTNPQDLVCFLPSPSPCFKRLFPISLACCAAPIFPMSWIFFFSLHFDFYVFAQLPSMTFLPLILFSGACSRLQMSHRLIFSTVRILAPSCPHFACHSQTPTFPLPPHSLSPSSIPLSLPVVTAVPAPLPFFLFCFSPSSLSSFVLSPTLPWVRSHWQGPKVHLHLCSRLRWTIIVGHSFDLGRAVLLWQQCKSHVELPPSPWSTDGDQAVREFIPRYAVTMLG